MRVCPLRYSKALSPYAQALRHVALRGAAALGPSAREMEIEMFRKGTLPADYRPPAHGKWDDTIERWAYAWQYPAEEDTRDEAQAVEKNAAAMQALLEFGERLISSPPSSDPNSGKHSSLYLDKMQRSQPLLSSGLMNDDYKDLEEAIESLQDSHVSHGASSVIPVVDFSRSTGIPMAYLDDGSERTNASKELGALLESSGLEYTEEGLIVVLTALARQHYYDVARAVFNFASGVGLGPSAEMYKALMKHSSSQGDVNHSMAIIEEMKEKGITPGIGNWHELMRSFHNARDYPAVSQIVDNMKMYANIEPNEVTFALQLRALGKDHTQLNSMAEAVQLFDQMENVYGYIASRSHYDAMMFALSQSPLPEMRLRCEELAQKMDLMGIVWNGTTYLNLIRSAQVVGDVTAVEKYLGKMRDDRIPMTIMHLTWAVHAHVQCIIRLDYGTLADKDDSNVMSTWLDHMNTCFGIYELVVTRGWEVQLPFVNALLRLCCQSAILSIEHLPSDGTAAGRFEEQASKLWNDTFDEWHLKKDIYSYECYIALLAHQQRIDEAEKLFQQLVMQEDLVPTRRTYECLIFMHLSSGEEGGAARALHYLEAMENARIHIRPALLKKMVRVHNAAGYKRDMKRRARRIMQAREEFLAKKTEGLGFPQDVSSQMQNSGEESQVPQPLPIHPRSTLAWWEEWKQSTISKHELFDEESSDGTPKGESFEEKNSALSLMGIQSQFPTISDVPQLDRHELLPKLRGEEGEVTGSLWALDGGELSYPKDGGGPQGWGVRLWRERALLKKEYQKVLDGKVAPAPFSELGKSVRVAGDQLDIEDSGATNPGELSDSRQFTDHRYENGSMKPPSEMAHSVDAAGELVWNSERRDALAPYKTDEELALEADNTFYAQMEATSNEKVKEVVEVLKNKQENEVDIYSKGSTRRSKYDYLSKWREMYGHGTLEAPEAPTLRFGRTPEDHKETLASSVKAWYGRNKRSPAEAAQIQRWSEEESRTRETHVAESALHRAMRKRGNKKGPKKTSRSE